jgi:hypothetical protein
MQRHSQEAFTADKLGKMRASGGMPAKPRHDAEAKADDYGKKAAGPSDSSQKFKRGGAVHGERAKMRMDRPGRAHGGKVKGAGKTQINIIMGDKGLGQGQQAQPMPVPVPVPAGGPPPMPPRPMAPPMVPPGAGPPPPGMMPPGAGAGMPPGMPLGRKRGGRVNEMGGDDRVVDKPGSGSGEGRLAKAKGEAAYARRG